MKIKFMLTMLFFVSISPLLAQSDCADAITVCGNTGYSGLTATGGGNADELNFNNNDCSGIETNSLWLKMPVQTGGTLGFILTPTNLNINVDFDFYVFGPTASCNNLGNTIRCSTTNPEASGAANNLTGMIEQETDIAEGPGDLGSNFVNWLTVQPGDVYYLVIDRPIGGSDFSIEWTGTATFFAAPQFNNPQAAAIDILKCDNDSVDDQVTQFDLTANEAAYLNGQANVAITYHTSLNDAIVGENPIATPNTYFNVSNPETVYIRMQNINTDCFINSEFQIEVTNPVVAGQPVNLELCDFKEDGIQRFNLAVNDALIRDGNTTASVTYYASQSDAQQEMNPLPPVYESATKTIWARLENTSGCQGHDITSFTITVTPLPDILYTLDITDLSIDDNSISIVMPDAEDYEFALDNGSFSDNPVFTGLEPGPYTISIRAKTGCKTVSEEVVILNYPRFFTPNGDNQNETWRIPYLNLESQAQVTIFDRYGKIIKGFTGSGSWDGTLNDSKLPSTDYWFVLQLHTGRIIKGHFSMVR